MTGSTRVYDKLKLDDGTWHTFERQWQSQCEDLGHDYEEFRQGRIELLESIAETNDNDTSICGAHSENGFASVFMANYAAIKGYRDKVLRIRHVTFSPELDYSGDTSSYVTELGRVLKAILIYSQDIGAKHLKIHASSPHDAQLFSALSTAMNETGVFKEVEFKGMWLYITY